MDDVLLILFLKKKGIISDRDMHEFHELMTSSISLDLTPVYLTKTVESMTPTDNIHMSESEAKNIVSKMYHIENGRKYIGEKFDIYKAKEICERYRGSIPTHITPCDIYVAINSQYHNYISLFKTWFNDNIDWKVIESAMVFWFMDDDCDHENKVYKFYGTH